MKEFGPLLLILFSITTLFHPVFCAKTRDKQPVKSQDDAYAYLNKFGYNPCKDAKVQCSLSLKSLLQTYQKLFHLKVTGKLDDSTKQHMNRPRCGLPDKPLAQSKAPSQLSNYIWKRSSLTYSLRNFPSQITQVNTDRIIREAFDAWLIHIPLEIQQVCSTCNADFVLEFAQSDHRDNYAFDGVGGTLAHAFFPEDGRVHFDADEEWTELFNGVGNNLYLVAVHEIGHALGLDHVYNTESIMYPSYQLMKKSNVVPSIDRRQIQTLYGQKQSSPTTATRKPTITTTTTTRRSIITTKPSVTVPSGGLHPRCRRFLDVAFGHPDGTLHTFDAGVLWRYLPNEHRWDGRTQTFQQVYARLPKRLSAGVYDPNRQKVMIFAGRNIYQYDIDHQHRAQYRSGGVLPRNLQNSVVGAIYYKRAIYIITAQTIRLFEPDSNYRSSSERDLSEEFPDFAGTVTTAFSYQNLHHFFTSDRLVYVWDENMGTWRTFGKPMETGWFACSNSANSYAHGTPPDKSGFRSPSGVSHRHHHHHRHQDYD
ncbi:unnamed protein product [Adineta ricciae]|uniref:Peptidase metallopeptidase domain-containing protein n=1 Tax=Adineta ricciae TaxID=249248 RepID=A0A813TI50_ADIRI|nr:unnamed protein product [Adineta ricciae]CAF0978554.1 unnamed protein product [Adineta ricciae]